MDSNSAPGGLYRVDLGILPEDRGQHIPTSPKHGVTTQSSININS
jgi:hypothetical protein